MILILVFVGVIYDGIVWIRECGKYSLSFFFGWGGIGGFFEGISWKVNGRLG